MSVGQSRGEDGRSAASAVDRALEDLRGHPRDVGRGRPVDVRRVDDDRASHPRGGRRDGLRCLAAARARALDHRAPSRGHQARGVHVGGVCRDVGPGPEEQCRRAGPAAPRRTGPHERVRVPEDASGVHRDRFDADLAGGDDGRVCAAADRTLFDLVARPGRRPVDVVGVHRDRVGGAQPAEEHRGLRTRGSVAARRPSAARSVRRAVTAGACARASTGPHARASARRAAAAATGPAAAAR